jgi:hypothetical protein
MPELKLSADCGNSPKNQFVEQLAVALLLGDRATLEASLSENLLYERAGDETSLGKAELLAGKHLPADETLASLEIEHVLSHGRVGAVNAIARFASGRTWSFCCVCEFLNNKATSIKSIKIYLIEAR